jgi:hypothetical protein
MKPRRTHDSTNCLSLPGGNEDNDLWIERANDGDGGVILCSVWEPTPDERERIAAGENVELLLWSPVHPPVSLRTTGVALGKPPNT